MINGVDWFIRFNLPRYFFSTKYAKNGNTFLYFEREVSNTKDGFQSEIITGRIVYKDESGHSHRSSPLLVKVFPGILRRSIYTELAFANEIFVYSKLLPFYASLNDSVEKLFAKFYFGNLTLGEMEDGSVMIEDLRESGYRSTTSRIFLDMEHLTLMMKKLGEFHAYSYLAKNTRPEEFYSLVDTLMENNFSSMKLLPGYLQAIYHIYLEFLSKDERYVDKVKKFEVIEDADDFCEEIFTSRNEPVTVLCHGDFLRNNVLFKYDSEMNPIDVKFIDVANMRYCTPVVDLGLVLYMNTDQKTRDEYWDRLLDVYYEALRNTFPGNKVPSKIEILSEFKRNILQPFLFTAMFLPVMFLTENNSNPDWFRDFFAPEYEEYKGKSFASIPMNVLIYVIRKFHKGRNSEMVLNVMKDILNKGFI